TQRRPEFEEGRTRCEARISKSESATKLQPKVLWADRGTFLRTWGFGIPLGFRPSDFGFLLAALSQCRSASDFGLRISDFVGHSSFPCHSPFDLERPTS